MKRRTSLSEGGFSIVIIAGINLLLLLCVCFVLQNHLAPRFGFNVHMASSHFVMRQLDRNDSKIITIGAGDYPRFYLGAEELRDGWNGVDRILTEWANTRGDRLTVVIVADAAVATGTTQKLMDKILKKGFSCTIASRPSLD